jgi:hypothetical protein
MDSQSSSTTASSGQLPPSRSSLNMHRPPRFTERLLKHGFYKDNSMLSATVGLSRKLTTETQRPVTLQATNKVINNDLAVLLELQCKLKKQQEFISAEITLRKAAIRVQNWYRILRSLRMLRVLKLSRFATQRWKFFVYFRIRKAKALSIEKAYKFYKVRSTFKFLLVKSWSIRRIQKIWRKYRFRMLSRRILYISQEARLTTPHCVYFGMRRAVVKLENLCRLNLAQRSLGHMIIKLWRAQFQRRRSERCGCNSVMSLS